MKTIVFPPPPFELWCRTVNLYLEVYAGRPLADLPDLDARLRVWHDCGIPARVVASGLTTLCPPKATLTRAYQDTRPAEVRAALLARLQQRGVLAVRGA